MSQSQQKFSVCMQRLKQQINHLSSNIVEKTVPDVLDDLHSHLKISNQQVRYQLQHGQEFKEMLDARDKVLEHSFSFQHIISKAELELEGEKFVDSQLFKAIMAKIKQFLAESISNVVSISFKFMCKGELEGRQAKDYAAKNIMLNVLSVYRQTVHAIEGNQILKEKFNLQDLRTSMIIEVDNVINNILINLADSYPQAPVAGGTPRMREVITEVNRVDDQANDFIFTSGIKLKDYIQVTKETQHKGKNNTEINLEQNDDYTEFIMRVVNSAVEVANCTKQDSRERTFFQIFTQFNQKMFWLSQQKNYQKLLVSISKKNIKETVQERKSKQKETDGICNLFRRILKTQGTGYQQYEEELILWMVGERSNQMDGTKVIKQLGRNWQSSEEAIDVMKTNKQFSLGHKIPSSVRPFDRQEITNRQFTARHSSILRILTKWAGYLEEIFSNSQQMIKQRLYPFVNLDNQFVHLKIGDKNGDQKLTRQLDEEYNLVRGKFNVVLQNSYGFIGKLMSADQQSIVSSVARYTETRTVSSKVNAVLTSLMLNYINILIHHLLKAGQNISSERGPQNLNLVVFRITDLMRSKYHCSQAAFINVLKTMYLLDSNEEMQTKFKLVRIKNKLDQPANNIMINYLFMGKVQCELQLSIQETKGKEKNYFTFSHFVYQLTRGKFGSIAECAIMISQLDPMIGACKEHYYKEKQAAIVLSRQSTHVEDTSMIRQSLLCMADIDQSKVIKTVFFECSQCGQLITNQNIAKILEKPDLKICYQCILKKPKIEEYLKKQLSESLNLIKNRRIKSYRYLNIKNQNEKYAITLNTVGQLSFSIVLSSPRYSKIFVIYVDSRLLQTVNYIDFNDLAYLDISPSVREGIEKQHTIPTLTYLFDKVSLIPKQLFKMIKIDPEGLQMKLNEIISQFRVFRIQKNIIKGIKYKAQIIKANEEQGKILDRICEVLVLGETIKYSNEIIDNVVDMAVDQSRIDNRHLHYTKEKSLDMSYIDKIQSQRAGFQSIPRWIKYCNNLQVLDLDYNNIRKIMKQELPTSIQELSLKKNQLQSIDLTGMVALQSLNLRCNKLVHIDISDCSSIVDLTLRENELQNIESLPPSLKRLTVDRNAILKFNFAKMLYLQMLRIRKGKTTREDLIGLAPDVKIYSKEH